MQGGGGGEWHAVQQVLAAEAAVAVRQGMFLARRHGYAKVTPLHVASAMLSSGPHLLRAACIRSRTRPLQCEALELFLVRALDRLPAAAAGVLPSAVDDPPGVSNALAAVVKRAKALLKRRGSTKQKRLDADTKVGLELLLVSILDDPGVCRAMHEAGFSSSQVKADVEKAASLNHENTALGRMRTSPHSNSFSHIPKLKASIAMAAGDGDDMHVPDCMASGTKRRCVVIGGEIAEGVVMKQASKASSLRHDSEGQTSRTKLRKGCTFDGRAAAGDSNAFTANLPPWLHHSQAPDPTLATCGGTTLQLSHELRNTWSSSSADGSFVSGFSDADALSSKPLQLVPRQPSHHSKPYYGQQRPHGNPNRPETMAVCGSSSNAEKAVPRQMPRFTELTAENLKILCDALEKGAPRHKDAVQDMAMTVLLCRSGMARWRAKTSLATSLLFQGRDSGSKKAVAQELAKLVYGSTDQVNCSPSSFIAELAVADKMQHPLLHSSLGFVKRFYEVIHECPRRLIMIHNFEHLDYNSKIAIKDEIATGRMRGSSGAEVSLQDAIIILSCETVDSNPWDRVNHRVSSHDRKNNEAVGVEGKAMKVLPGFSLDLNDCPDVGVEEEASSSLNDAGMLNVLDGVFIFPLIN